MLLKRLKEMREDLKKKKQREKNKKRIWGEIDRQLSEGKEVL